MKKNYFFRIIFILFTINFSAQSVCQDQLVINNEASGSIVGQSIFMSGCNGYFNSIDFNRTNSGSQIIAELNIFIGQTSLGTPLYTQSVTIPPSAGIFTIDFTGGTGNLAFFENSQYTFMLSNATFQLESSNNIDSYTDGQMFVDAGFINNDDLWFKLYTTPSLGIDNHQIEKLSLLPNPATDYFKISGIYNQEVFTIYNTLGVPVKNGLVYGDETIDIQSFPIGLYYLKLSEGNTLKFIKK